MPDTMAVICPACEGWVYLNARELDKKDAAEATSIMADINGTMRLIDSADVRSGKVPVCRCRRSDHSSYDFEEVAHAPI
jgi:hypothetical protein